MMGAGWHCATGGMICKRMGKRLGKCIGKCIGKRIGKPGVKCRAVP